MWCVPCKVHQGVWYKYPISGAILRDSYMSTPKLHLINVSKTTLARQLLFRPW